MSETCENCGETFFFYGDRVRLVQNHLLTGQVIGEKDWHTEYLVRVGSTVSAIWFNACELEPDPDFEPPQDAAVPIPAEDGNNIISFADARVRAAGGLH